MRTAKQRSTDAKQARRERELEARKRDKQLLAKLRGHLRSARGVRARRLREVGIACRRARRFTSKRAQAIRAAARAAAQAEIDRARAASRTTCEARKTQARAKSANSVTRALAALEAERAHQATLAVYAKPLKAAGPRPTGAAKRARAREQAAESDSEVEANLPEDMLPVWRAVKKKIKASPRRTRTEAFLEWANEHRADVLRIQDAQIDRDVAELVKHEAELRSRVGSRRYYRTASDAQLDDVPF